MLADVLALSGVRGTLGARIEAGEHWGVWWRGIRGAAFHAVTAGVAWLGVPDHPPIKLMPGDVVLLTSGLDHRLSSDPATLARRCDHGAAERARADGQVLSFGSGAVQTHILSASYTHDPAVLTQVLTLLPEIVHLHADHGGSCLSDTVRLLARELASPQIATTIVLNSLVDVLLVQLLRVWLSDHPVQAAASWLGVLSDPLISRALSKLHGDPARDWTTASLAAEISVSRATLSRRFPAVVGRTPGAYLTRWRMDLAALHLRDTDDDLETIARSVGYSSVYAFSRAFSRARAQPPGRYRLAARAQVDGDPSARTDADSTMTAVGSERLCR